MNRWQPAFIIPVLQCILCTFQCCIHAFNMPATTAKPCTLSVNPTAHSIDRRRNSRCFHDTNGRISEEEDAFRRPLVGRTWLGRSNTTFSQSHIRELPVGFTPPHLNRQRSDSIIHSPRSNLNLLLWEHFRKHIDKVDSHRASFFQNGRERSLLLREHRARNRPKREATRRVPTPLPAHGFIKDKES